MAAGVFDFYYRLSSEDCPADDSARRLLGELQFCCGSSGHSLVSSLVGRVWRIEKQEAPEFPQEPPAPSGRNPRGRNLLLRCAPRLFQDHFGHLAHLPVSLGQDVSVTEGSAEIRVPESFLDPGDVRAVLQQSRSVRVARVVQPHLRQFCRLQSLLPASSDLVRVGHAADCVGEDEVLTVVRLASQQDAGVLPLLVRSKGLYCGLREPYPASRAYSLGGIRQAEVAVPIVDDRALDGEPLSVEIEVRPLERQSFLRPEPSSEQESPQTAERIVLGCL